MAKELNGWRGSRSWETDHKDTFLNGIANMARSDDGWICPQCQHRYTLENCNMGEGISNEDYYLLMEDFGKIKFRCDNCDKEYYVRCFNIRRFYSCEDREFGL